VISDDAPQHCAHARPRYSRNMDSSVRVSLKVLSSSSLRLTIQQDAVSLLTLPDVLQLEI